jgi:hypothetical protein
VRPDDPRPQAGQQFDAIPRTPRAVVPMMSPLPVPGGLGATLFAIDRAGHFVMYVPLTAIAAVLAHPRPSDLLIRSGGHIV